MKFKGLIIATAFLGFLGADFSAGLAQQGTLLGSFRDWDALVRTNGNGEKICYMISIPKAKQPTTVNHGDVYITVTHRPRRKVKDEINMVTAYDLRTGSEVQGTIGSSRYSLFTEGKGAWNYDQASDSKMVNGMKLGNTLVMNAISARGTNTTYRFSLAGFSAAYDAITRECS